ncbi:MAG: keto-deoxy-phosphogluconate aldolase [Rickettsiales bacterium]|nr:keto-deoxy-phosphogluconate aldolase [Rickettsiales bacterium]|tara:strand:+ start:464 stop:1090 length:627 start_codon:yes stop_codon:yes gene_type:complete
MSAFDTLYPKPTLIPVVVVDAAEDAVPLAEALVEGGITSIEITLRTAAGLRAIEQVAKQVPGIIAGAGTVINPQQMQQACDAGAQFQVSPGMTKELAEYAQKEKIAWLPGTANASDIMMALQYGFNRVKLFPASLAGGAAAIKQYGAVFGDVKFCPTGGISLDNMADYAAQSNVFAIGGSWLTPKAMIAEKNFAGITTIARDSLAALA